VVLVESPLDVLRLAAVGVAAVAAYGAYVSNAQVTLLVEYADHVILALDNDKAGVEQTQKLFPKLCRRLPTTRVVYPEGIKDPGDMTDKQARKLIDF
jgi:DNA primase